MWCGLIFALKQHHNKNEQNAAKEVRSLFLNGKKKLSCHMKTEKYRL